MEDCKVTFNLGLPVENTLATKRHKIASAELEQAVTVWHSYLDKGYRNF